MEELFSSKVRSQCIDLLCRPFVPDFVQVFCILNNDFPNYEEEFEMYYFSQYNKQKTRSLRFAMIPEL